MPFPKRQCYFFLLYWYIDERLAAIHNTILQYFHTQYSLVYTNIINITINMIKLYYY